MAAYFIRSVLACVCGALFRMTLSSYNGHRDELSGITETESGSWRLYLPEDRKTERIGGVRGISAKDRNKTPSEYKSAAFRCFECQNMFHVPNAQPLSCSALPRPSGGNG